MKTVRLPIYDEEGFMTGEMLEVDLNYFLPPSRAGLVSSQVRILQPPLAEWEKELLEAWEADQEGDEVGLETESEDNVEIEWRDLEGIPTKAFEISSTGVIRIKASEKVIDANWWDVDRLKFNVKLKINGMDYYIDGPKLAEKMWAKMK